MMNVWSNTVAAAVILPLTSSWYELKTTVMTMNKWYWNVVAYNDDNDGDDDDNGFDGDNDCDDDDDYDYSSDTLWDDEVMRDTLDHKTHKLCMR